MMLNSRSLLQNGKFIRFSTIFVCQRGVHAHRFHSVASLYTVRNGVKAITRSSAHDCQISSMMKQATSSLHASLRQLATESGPESQPPGQTKDLKVVLSLEKRVPLPVSEEQLYRRIRHLHQDQVLAMLQESHDQLDKTHLALCMKRLYLLGTKMPVEEWRAYKERVEADPGFQILCARLAQKAPYLEPAIVFEMLKFMTRFDLDSNHRAVQVFLELSKSTVNDLSLAHLTQLAYVVSRLSPTAQTQVVLEGAQTLLCSDRMQDITSLTTWELITCLEVCGSRLDATDRLKLLNGLRQDPSAIGWKYAVILLRALAQIQEKDTQLENYCLDQILCHVDALSPTDMASVLDACIKQDVYCPELLSAAGDMAAMGSYTMDEKLTTLFFLHIQSYVHSGLLEDIQTTLTRDPDLIKGLSVDQLVELVRCCSDAQMHSDNTTALLQYTCEDMLLMVHQVDIYTLLNFCLALLSLDYRPPSSLVGKILNKEVVEGLIQKHQGDDFKGSTGLCLREKLLMLHVADSSLKGDLDCEEKIAKEIYDAVMQIPRRKSSLTAAMETAMGGKNYVIHGACTFHELHIDHLVYVESGEPFALPRLHDLKEDEEVKKSGHVEEEHHCQSVALLVLPALCFNRNTGQMKGTTHLYASMIQKDRHLLLVMNEDSFWKIEERDKIPYLQHKILNADKFQKLELLGLDNL